MKQIHSAAIFLLLFLGPFVSQAGLMRVQSDTYYSQRKGDDKKTEMPLYEQFSVSYLTDTRQESFDIDFSYAYDFEKRNYDFDLYQLNGQFEFAQKKAKLSVGRSFQTYRLIRSSVVDSISSSYLFFEDRAEAGVLLGKARQFELDRDEEEANISAVFVDYKTADVFPWKWGARVENRDFSAVQRENYTWGKASLKKEWPVSLHPEISLVAEKNLGNTSSYRHEMGVDLYPSIYTTYGVRLQQYRMNADESWEDPISSIFSRSEIREMSLTFGHKWNANWYSGGDVAVDTYDVEPGRSTTGGKLEALVRWQTEGQYVEFNAFRFSSFGGWALGEKVRWVHPLSDKMEWEMSQEYVEYEKITSARSAASSTQLGFATWLWKHCRLWVAGEYNRNNFYSQDISFLSRLTIYDWREM
ncbi:MAG: hypothetical protein KUL82_04735 [Bdellovibrio sp.]|nr:hypothetical protein [Bdellovibrio sp.]